MTQLLLKLIWRIKEVFRTVKHDGNFLRQGLYCFREGFHCISQKEFQNQFCVLHNWKSWTVGYLPSCHYLLNKIKFNPFLPNVPLWSPKNHQKTKGFLMFSGRSKGNIGKKSFKAVILGELLGYFTLKNSFGILWKEFFSFHIYVDESYYLSYYYPRNQLSCHQVFIFPYKQS